MNKLHDIDKDPQIYRLSTEVESTIQLQDKDRFTLILGYELCSILNIVMWGILQHSVMSRVHQTCIRLIILSLRKF